jgi:hypothetical protein
MLCSGEKSQDANPGDSQHHVGGHTSARSPADDRVARDHGIADHEQRETRIAKRIEPVALMP